MATAIKCVCVWEDETDDDKWIVSLDKINGSDTECTETLSVHNNKASAKNEALRQGLVRKLPVYQFESASDGYGLGNRHTLIKAFN